MFVAAARAGVELYAGNLADASSLIAEAYAITDATDGRNVPYAPVETEYHRKAMRSQWLTVGAETDPLTRARKLQRSWERLLAGGALGPELPPGATVGLRPTIVESWRRSLATGLDPTDLLAPIEADVSEVLERWFEHPLGSLTHILTEQLRKVAEESRGIAVVTDASGLVLHRVGDEGLKERAAEMNLVEGARYSEAADGTNGIGTALAADHAFQVFAFEHFNERHHQWVCSGAPVHDPVSGRTVGLIDLSSLWKTAHPRSLELVTTAARTMEQCLLEVRRDQDSRLRRRYGDLMTRSTDLLVNRDGYVLAGAEPARSKPLDIPEGGGEVVLGDGSIAVAAVLGQGEAYILRQVTTRHAKSAPVEVLERAEKHVRELVAEQAALRQVATLVARESSPGQLFAVVAEQVARVFDVPHVRLVRYEPDGSVVVGGISQARVLDGPFPIGSRWPLDSPGVTATVQQTGRPARVEDYADMTGQIAAVVRDAGMRSTVASPIVVEGRLWGAMVVLSPRHEPFPEDTEARLTDFTELVATAIANAESRVAIGRLAKEQAALRRVATLVAHGAQPNEVFWAVSDEVGRLFGTEFAAVGRFEPDGRTLGFGARRTHVLWDADFLASAEVLRTGRSARAGAPQWESAEGETAERLRSLGIVSSVASPIVVEGALWGVMLVASTDEPLPPDTEERLEKFTDIVATAIANADSRSEIERLADQQAALRRVATLVAGGAAPADVFTAVAWEVAQRFDFAAVTLSRYEDDAVVVLADPQDSGFPVGSRWPFDGDSLSARVRATGRMARIDDYSDIEGSSAARMRERDSRSAIGVPIVVEGSLWGILCVGAAASELLPVDTEARIAGFVELVGTAIANSQARDGLRALADEHAALHRVAALVARDTPPGEVFDAVAMEVGKLLDTDITVVGRYDDDGAATAIGSWSASPGGVPVGTRSVLGGRNVLSLVGETERPARVDEYDDASGEAAEIARRHGWRSSIAAPISVAGRLWGVMLVATQRPERFPAGAEERLAAFTDLVATAIANAESKSELAASRRRIVTAGDEARRRIERNLHDGTQQRLIALGLDLQAVRGTVPRELSDTHEGLDRMRYEIDSVLDDVRELSRGLHPALLSRAGLRPSLRALARRSPIPVDFEIQSGDRPPEPVETCVYFVVSEALTNAVKHSRASTIAVEVAWTDSTLRATIEDDGVGGAEAGAGSGLTGLIDRVEALGGRLVLRSPSGGGTHIAVELPFATEMGI